MIGRRSFITGLVSLVAAPAIVRAGSLMPVRVMPAIEMLEAWQKSTPYTMGDMISYFDMELIISDIAGVMAIPSQWIRSQ